MGIFVGFGLGLFVGLFVGDEVGEMISISSSMNSQALESRIKRFCEKNVIIYSYIFYTCAIFIPYHLDVVPKK